MSGVELAREAFPRRRRRETLRTLTRLAPSLLNTHSHSTDLPSTSPFAAYPSPTTHHFRLTPSVMVASFEAQEDQRFAEEVAKVKQWWKASRTPSSSATLLSSRTVTDFTFYLRRRRGGRASCVRTVLSKLCRSGARSRSRTRQTNKERSSSRLSRRRRPRARSRTRTERESACSFALGLVCLFGVAGAADLRGDS